MKRADISLHHLVFAVFLAFFVLGCQVGPNTLIWPSLKSSFTYSPDSPAPGQAVLFNDSSAGSPTIWQWDFGDGTSSIVQHPNHIFMEVGSYEVVLVVGNASATNSSRRTINVMPLSIIVAPGRIIDWSRAGVWYGGVQGIPEYPTGITCSSPAYAVNPTGTVDSTAGINAAIAACPAGYAVYLPAGTYVIAGGIKMKSGVVLRGSGPGRTILKITGAAAAAISFSGGGFYWSAPASHSVSITGGAIKGSNSIMVSSASSITIGNLYMITELNDPTFVSNTSTNGTAGWVDGWDDNGARARGQIVRATSKNGNMIGIYPALYSDYSNSPWFTIPQGAPIKNAGVESLTLYATNSGCYTNIQFSVAENCWAYKIHSDFADGDHVSIDQSLNCEVRKCWFDDSFVHAPGQHDNQVGLRYKTSECLVVDNIVTRLHLGILTTWGAAGNVVGYNYVDDGYADNMGEGSRPLNTDIDYNHGAHPQYNLFEGNMVGKIISDSYWGTASHGVLLRNFCRAQGTAHGPYSVRGTYTAPFVLTQDISAIQLWEGQSYFTVIGNVLGDETISGYTFKITNPASRSYTGKYIWALGYASSADSGGRAILANPSLTLIDHGNYDYVNGGATWDPGIPDRDIPPSLFLPSKPAWFGSSTWPPIGPDVAGYHTDIPAKARWDAYLASAKADLSILF